MPTNTINDSETAVQERLEQIAAAMAAKNGAGAANTKPKAAATACPIDPTERALCDSCQ